MTNIEKQKEQLKELLKIHYGYNSFRRGQKEAIESILLGKDTLVVLPTGGGYGVAFSPDGTHMAVGHATSPYITIYKREGDTFTKLANPSGLPAGEVYGAAFWPSSLYPST